LRVELAIPPWRDFYGKNLEFGSGVNPEPLNPEPLNFYSKTMPEEKVK